MPIYQIYMVLRADTVSICEYTQRANQGARQKAKGKRQKAKGKRQKSKGKSQKAEGRRIDFVL